MTRDVASGLAILLVEDDPLVRETLAAALDSLDTHG